MEGKRPSESKVTLTKLMLPNDANPRGNVHGGAIMRLVDEAGALATARHSRRMAVTVAIDSMTFHRPVYVGDVVTAEAVVTWTGRTAMEVAVRVEAENLHTGARTHTASAYAVYVALDDEGRPTPVPPLILETEDEKRIWQEAKVRQESRLKSGRMRAQGGGY